MTTEANFPLQQLCLKPSLYGRFSLDHLWPLLGDHQGQGLTFSEVSEIVISPRTLKHRKARRELLSVEETGRMLRVARVLSLADQVFGNHEKALTWLRQVDERLNQVGAW
jgi:hypothetical protein